MPLVKDGAHTLLELADLTRFALLARPVKLDDKSVKRLDLETSLRLGRLKDALAQVDDWNPRGLEAALRGFAEAEGMGMGRFGPALRGVLAAAIRRAATISPRRTMRPGCHCEGARWKARSRPTGPPPSRCTARRFRFPS